MTAGRVGLIFPSFLGREPDGRFHLERTLQAEELGFDAVYAGDHLFGYMPTPDPLAILAGMAAVTTRVTLGTLVLLLGLREPAIVAKQVATVEGLCPGRFVFGVGVGGEMEQEWDAMGVPLRRRGARVDEYLAVVRQLWSGGEVDHQGEFRTIRGVVGSPRPVTPGGPPVWIGGRSDAAIQRATRHDGWCGYAMSPRSVMARVTQLRAARGELFPTSAVIFTRVESSAEKADSRRG